MLARMAVSLGKEWENLGRCFELVREEQRQREALGTLIGRVETDIAALRDTLEHLKSEHISSSERSRGLEQELRTARSDLEAAHSAFLKILEERSARRFTSSTPDPKLIEGLEFLDADEPEISIVIPVFNQFDLTVQCLRSISENAPGRPFEVIISDDGSDPKLAEVLSGVPGLKVSRSQANLGFIATCNRGADCARGDYLLFLNNDTRVLPACIEELRKTFELFPEAGLVGAKLLYPEGTLQEAGSIVWSSGSAWNYGKNDDPRRPEYNFLRDVDYCSAACVMIPRELFRALNGFDERYAPAYCEDSDLAFRVKARGRRVLYQPLAEVVHYEGVTAGTDGSIGHKRYQSVNMRKLSDRWGEVLKGHRPDGEKPHLEKERNVTKRMLVVDACVLTPDQDAGSLTVFNFIRIFQSLGYKVTFVAENLLYEDRYTADMQRLGIECLYTPYLESIASHLEEHGSEYQTVFLCRPGVAGDNIDLVRRHCPQARVVFDTEDLHFVRERRRAAIENDPAVLERAEALRSRELDIAAKADCTVVVSPAEREILLAESPSLNVVQIHPPRDVFGPGHDFARRNGLIFIGGFQHTPNVDAALFFVDRILPLVEARLPGIQLYLVGSKPPRAIKELESDNVFVTGYLPDLSEQASTRRVSVAPVRYGAGIKCKILTSLGHGLPVVATSLAVEGMGLVHRKDVLVADTPRAFAEAVVELYSDRRLWSNLSRAGLESLNRAYSFSAARERFAAILP